MSGVKISSSECLPAQMLIQKQETKSIGYSHQADKLAQPSTSILSLFTLLTRGTWASN